MTNLWFGQRVYKPRIVHLHCGKTNLGIDNFLNPINGFDAESVYANFHYLLSAGNNILLPLELRRSYPWIIWMIWKNRNNFFFDEKRFEASEIVEKIREDTSAWFLAKIVKRN